MANSKTYTFHFFPAFFAGFDGTHDEIKIWLQYPWDEEFQAKAYNDQNNGKKRPEGLATITIDLGQTPRKIDQGQDGGLVQLDDHANVPLFGFTTLGPMFPHGYGTGAVYLNTEWVSKNVETIRAALLPADTSARKSARDNENEKQRSEVLKDVLGTSTGLWPGWSHDLTACCEITDGKITRWHGFWGRHLHKVDGATTQGLWIICHPGHAGAKATRAPRKVYIDDPSLKKSEDSWVKPRADFKAIYLEQDFAKYVAVLDVPKRPTSAGEGILSNHGDNADSKHVDTSTHLSVFGAPTTGEIDRIRERVQSGSYTVIPPGGSLADAVSQHHKAYPYGIKYLDLIGHSRAKDHALKLGERVVTPRYASEEFGKLAAAGVLAEMGIEHIRLLGCRTACHPSARRVIEAIRGVLSYYELRIEVHAARGDLYAAHFDRHFKKEMEALLAPGDVVAWNGPGDEPPEDDYPVLADDEFAYDMVDDVHAPDPAPRRFEWAALSEVNSAKVAAKEFAFWDNAAASFENLQRLIKVEVPMSDNPYQPADYEVFVATSRTPRSLDDFRSFDVMLEPPRLRVHTRDAAYSFPFAGQGAQSPPDGTLNKITSLLGLPPGGKST